jgi:5-methylcytosine-specific restriction endonuclease McrA
VWAIMEDEAVIIEVKPKMVDINTFDTELGTYACSCNYEKELYEVNQPITHRPEYIAIRDPDTIYIELLFRIDHVIPFSKGGPTEESNLRVLCEECNREKSASVEI